jgi:hypothetical protein
VFQSKYPNYIKKSKTNCGNNGTPFHSFEIGIIATMQVSLLIPTVEIEKKITFKIET